MTAPTCWADPLTRAERRVLREKLARACKAFWAATAGADHRRQSVQALTLASADMAELHLDVTERAAPPPASAPRRVHGYGLALLLVAVAVIHRQHVKRPARKPTTPKDPS